MPSPLQPRLRAACFQSGGSTGSSGNHLRVAVIGGGIGGATFAYQLTHLAQGKVRVTLFDRGRFPGGRCGHRRISEAGEVVGSEAAADAVFDHGCAFLTAECARFRETLLQDWLKHGWAARWSPKCGLLRSDPSEVASADPHDCSREYWGFPTASDEVYCGVGGMSQIVKGMTGAAATRGAIFCTGMVVKAMERSRNGTWELSGIVGKGAYHDTKLKELPNSLMVFGEFDVVVLTAPLATASRARGVFGVPESVSKRLLTHDEVPLFSGLVAYYERLDIEEDVFLVEDEELWFASRVNSKPGLDRASKYDCWVLHSTPEFAAAELERSHQWDPATGIFVPQDREQVGQGPGAALAAAFERLLTLNGHVSEARPMPRPLYVGGQRWASAFARARGGAEGASAPSPAPAGPAGTYFADDDLGVYAVGDYLVGGLRTGVENAAISGMDLARHVASLVV